MRRSTVIAAAFLLGCTAREVSAQGFINPFVGTTLTSPSPNGSSSRPGFGVALGGVGKIIGGETEIAYYPSVLDNAANGLAKSKVVTLSGNTLIGPMIGPVKAYGALGFGDVFLNVTSVSSIAIPNPASISNNYFAVNVGGGVMGFFSSHLGVRGDLRYYRAFGFKVADVQSATPGFALDRFDFWRANFGLVAKF